MSPYGWYQLGRVQHELGHTAKRRILDHLAKFEPDVARQLARETGLKAASLDYRGPAARPRMRSVVHRGSAAGRGRPVALAESSAILRRDWPIPAAGLAGENNKKCRRKPTSGRGGL